MKDSKTFSRRRRVEAEADSEKASCSYGSRDAEVPMLHTSVLSTLQAMGFSIEDAKEALCVCGTVDFDAIVNHILARQHEISLPEEETYPTDEDSTASGDSDCLDNDEASLFSGSNSNNEMTHLTTVNIPMRAFEDDLLRMGFHPELVKRAVKLHGQHCPFDVLVDFLVKNPDDSKMANSLIEGVETSASKEELGNSAKLMRMGFSSDAVTRAIQICGDVDYNILVDAIIANELERSEKEKLATSIPKDQSRENHNVFLGTKPRKKLKEAVVNDLEEAWSEAHELQDTDNSDSDEAASLEKSKSWKCTSVTVSKKRHFEDRKFRGYHKTVTKSSKVVFTSDLQLNLPINMTGFGTPGFPPLSREVDPRNKGPPYFYYEDLAALPKTAWDIIRRHFDDIGPEFVDAKYFCACGRQRGYVHNLPVEGRKLILPEPPMSIQELFPRTKEYWPSWDTRKKLNCINTKSAPDNVCRRIRDHLFHAGAADPSSHVQQEILRECHEWNLIWTGPGQPAPLEPHEVELLLGFDEDHTRGASNRTERFQSLGNSFQIHTLAYHLSVLKPLYPAGIRVLSLFSGIGGAEVALTKLGMQLLYVVSVETIQSNKLILQSWWKRTEQRGKLQQLESITDVTTDVLQRLIDDGGGFDLIIGGNPCNNFSPNSRKAGLSGPDPSLFHEFPRIVRAIKGIMRKKSIDVRLRQMGCGL